METENPYVVPETEPGDAGTEEWAEKRGSDRPAEPEPHHDPDKTDDDGVVEGSPAEAFIKDPDAIDARDDESGS